MMVIWHFGWQTSGSDAGSIEKYHSLGSPPDSSDSESFKLHIPTRCWANALGSIKESRVKTNFLTAGQEQQNFFYYSFYTQNGKDTWNNNFINRTELLLLQCWSSTSVITAWTLWSLACTYWSSFFSILLAPQRQARDRQNSVKCLMPGLYWQLALAIFHQLCQTWTFKY